MHYFVFSFLACGCAVLVTSLKLQVVLHFSCGEILFFSWIYCVDFVLLILPNSCAVLKIISSLTWALFFSLRRAWHKSLGDFSLWRINSCQKLWWVAVPRSLEDYFYFDMGFVFQPTESMTLIAQRLSSARFILVRSFDEFLILAHFCRTLHCIPLWRVPVTHSQWNE